jgi:hypothetical protein
VSDGPQTTPHRAAAPCPARIRHRLCVTSEALFEQLIVASNRDTRWTCLHRPISTIRRTGGVEGLRAEQTGGYPAGNHVGHAAATAYRVDGAA